MTRNAHVVKGREGKGRQFDKINEIRVLSGLHIAA